MSASKPFRALHGLRAKRGRSFTGYRDVIEHHVEAVYLDLGCRWIIRGEQAEAADIEGRAKGIRPINGESWR